MLGRVQSPLLPARMGLVFTPSVRLLELTVLSRLYGCVCEKYVSFASLFMASFRWGRSRRIGGAP